ncbi:PaaI family thioesterase [Pseudomonas solani]|uniref:PaaI family thioesterase n=1 Tax=Pseudomonas solani TaxID=2731552 RepID=UPI003F4AE2C0
MDKNAFFWLVKDGALPTPKAAATLGIDIIAVDGERGTIEVLFNPTEALTNPVGNIQGGFLAAMLDDTMGPALASTLRQGEFAPTLNLNISFHLPAKLGQIKGRGRVDRRGGHVCFLSGELEQDGQVIATASATALIQRVS